MSKFNAAYFRPTSPSSAASISCPPLGDEYIRQIIAAFEEIDPDILIPAHCTGDRFYDLARDAMGDKVVHSAVGMRFLFRVITDTIDYVATDQNGLTATSTRIVIIEAPSIAPFGDASTTDTTATAATSTSQ